jgi:WD40 repeat protein
MEEILLSDFGLAIVAQSSSQRGTHDVSGTIAYMAPEQAKGKPQPASDQYALGVVVYEWLCGTRPFTGTYEEIAIQHVIATPPPLHERMEGISPALEAIVMRTLEKDPHQRFTSVQDFALMLEQAYLAEHNEQEQIITTPSTASLSTTPPSTVVTHPETSYSTERTLSDIIYTVAWSPDKRRIAYGGRDRAVQVRGATTGASTLLYRGHSGSVMAMAWSPNGQLIASASTDRTIQVWNTLSGQKVVTYDVHESMVSALAWSPDGRFLASTCSGADNAIHIWDSASGHDHMLYRGHPHWVRAIAWSPDGKYIASGSWHEVQVWESSTGHKLFSYRGHHSWVRSVSWSPNGTRIASAGEDNTVQVWEANAKSHVLTTHRGHSDWINSVVWSPDGIWLASAGKDNAVHIWRAETVSNISIHHVRAAAPYAITWLLDSKHVVSASGNGTVHVWHVAPDATQ